MQLSDNQIRDLLPEMNFAIEEGADPFNPEEQVQPASIDLRLSSVFWKPLRRFTIDLRRSRLLELSPRRYYRRVEISAGDTITVRPFELLLARTLEEFTVPNGFSADIIGRSSFARLGLMVSATGNFINPGWRGHMPIQLTNLGPNPIKLVAGLPICQLRLAQLTTPATRPYGHPALGSIYSNDDGGPSYWWRDKRIQILHKYLSSQSVESRVQESLYLAVGTYDPDVIERLEKHLAKTRLSNIQDSRTMLEIFSKSEEKRRSFRRASILVARALITVGISTSLWVLNKPPYRWWHYSIWSAAFCSILISIYAFRTEIGEYFGKPEFERYYRQHTKDNYRD